MTTFNSDASDGQPYDLHNASSLLGPLRATPQCRCNANHTGLYTGPKHGDCLGRFSLTGLTLPKPSDFHTTESRDFLNVTPWQLPPITCGRRLSRSFTTTLEEDLHILAPALVELAVYVGKSGGAR